MTTTTVNKNLEQQLRRALNKHGYLLRKSRKPIGMDNLGEYMIVDLYGGYVVAGARFDFTLSDVADWLNEMCQE